jgi:hypothetical protein
MDNFSMKKIWATTIEHNFNKLSELVNQAIDEKADELILLAETEWEAFLKKEQFELLKEHNVKVRILHGCGINQYYVDYYNQIGYDINNAEFWRTFWFNWSSACLLGSKIDYRQLEIDSTLFKYPFINLNNRRHIHRCVFIDELAKQNLIDKGIVTWTNFLNENPNYQFKHFHGNQILLNDDFITKLDSFLIPEEWNQSLFHVITEATHLAAILSEKTAIPLLMKKPFLVFGCVGFHKLLVDLGFKLYDEVVDYSFDDEPDLQLRAEKYVQSVSKLTTLNLQDTYTLLKPKIDFNYNRVLEIIKSKEFIPMTVKERLEEIKLTGPVMLVDSRFEMFMNECND